MKTPTNKKKYMKAKKILPAKTPTAPVAKAAPKPVTKQVAAAPAKKAVVIPAAERTVKRKLPQPSVTTIVAATDVGWGNQIFVRGEGGGLSWEVGVPMTCSDCNEWVWVSTSNDPAFTFKFLVNDIFWSQGDNFAVARGETHSSSPRF
ncbi:MAG: hypothetical protein LBV28_05280 [Puniceicoccales bacterium]|nr:hypothetical protein [Puniceicoccales bacterium]